jgi:hypothetical protein
LPYDNPSEPSYIYPTGCENSKTVSFVLLQYPIVATDSSKSCLTPFLVDSWPPLNYALPPGWRLLIDPSSDREHFLCERTGECTTSPPSAFDPPSKKFYAVLCSSYPGLTKQLINPHKPSRHARKDKQTFAFWSLELEPDGREYKETKHGLKTGSIVSFSGIAASLDSAAPLEFSQGNRYVVVKATDYSFHIGGPLLCPSTPFHEASLAPEEPHFSVYRRSPVGRFRDAARRYHLKGQKSECCWSGIRADRLSSHHGEFCKFFCGQTSREVDFFPEDDYFESDASDNPEQLYNMIDMCKAFHSDNDCALFLSILTSELTDIQRSRLGDLLVRLRRAAVGLSSKEKEMKEVLGIRDFRNKLMHKQLSLDSRNFSSFCDCCFELLQCVIDISHLSKLYKSYDFQRNASAAIRAAKELQTRDFSKTSLSREELKAAESCAGPENFSMFKDVSRVPFAKLITPNGYFSSVCNRSFCATLYCRCDRLFR